jgi:uroporphyrinogen decarboxylase
MSAECTSLERTLAALSHREADRVPLFLLFTMHGARELGLSLEEYFKSPARVVEGQLRLRAKFGHDCLYAFGHASIEHEAFGGTTRFIEDGPPNAGAPILSSPEDLDRLEPPRVEGNAPLQRVLAIVEGLARSAAGEVPVLGVVVSPFSLPILQMGFPAYLDLLQAALYDDPSGERRRQLDRLFTVNLDFCIRWANAQLAAGATAIVCFDPMSSSTMTSRELGVGLGLPLARRAIAQIKGPVAMHFASGHVLPLVEDVLSTGAVALGVAADEDLVTLERATRGRAALVGNLNGVEMARWTPAEARVTVTRALEGAARGGGFILSDNHGEIPFQVPDDVLFAIVDTVRTVGRYPLPAHAGEDS